MRTIKRYSNRKLYCTETSKYVRLEQIADDIRDEKIKVIDNVTKEDITQLTKARAIFQQQLRSIKDGQ